jgi:membrane protease YdiL (CAAX protease family)
VWDRLPGVTAAAGVLAAYLVLGLPLSGLLARGELRRRLTHERGLRLTVYRQAISRLWLLAGAAIGMVGLAKVPVSALGLRAPSQGLHGVPELVAGTVLPLASVTVLAMLAGRGPASGTTSLLPVTRRERRVYVGVAFTAGAVEELLFRGFLMLYLTGALGWSVQISAAASALAFGISHLYQGAGTAIAAGVIGYGFAEVYLLTGSLLVPVAVHVLLDLRVLWAPAGTPRAGQKCRGVSRSSIRSPAWNTFGAHSTTPSPPTNNKVGAVFDA